MPMHTLDIDAVRAQFPALSKTDTVYADNAGGTQVLGSVVEYISNYLYTTNAQLGGLYGVSRSSSAAVSRGAAVGAAYVGGAGGDEVVFGSSTTQLFTNLSLALRCEEGDELVVSEMDHEANISPWHRLAALRRLKLHPWRVRKDTQQLHLDDLAALLNDRTRLVTLTHCSNMLGGINDVRSVCELVHKSSGAQVCVDGVAFAPHRAVDVRALGADFYCFSWYKVYGAHIAMLYASRAAQERLDTLGHYFHTGTDLGTRLGLAGGAYELQASVPSVVAYLRGLATGTPTDDDDAAGIHRDVVKAFDLIAAHEQTLSEVILSYMREKSDVFEIFGRSSGDAKLRVPLISFRVRGRKSSEIVDAIHRRSKIGLRNGHMYSKRMMDHLLGGDDGDQYAVRISLVHYNSIDEARDFVRVLKSIIDEAHP
ncbi:hypothetical protein PYCC9005_004509 [Savitreella phatthalungensis]